MTYWRLGCWFLLMVLACGVFAQDDDKAKAEGEEGEMSEEQMEDSFQPGSAIYVPVKPAFVVNYGGPGKLKYIKLEVSLRLEDTPSSNSVRHHMPLIRDYLVKLFSNLGDVDIDTQQAKERVRLAALEGIQQLIEKEDGKHGVLDLFFINFVVQR